jgi:two-component system, cell cycle response regulator CpdR
MPTCPTGTILLVDDEDGVRVSLRRLLTAVGHTVLEASHGAEAIDLVRRRRGNVDLVLADVVMPEMNGTELAATLDREFPGLPVLLMSAYAPSGMTTVGRQGHTVPVLQKPFDRPARGSRRSGAHASTATGAIGTLAGGRHVGRRCADTSIENAGEDASPIVAHFAPDADFCDLELRRPG